MVRMKDVAEHSKVSLKTVSRVLNNEPHVQDKLRERVLASIQELGYVPSASARNLRSQRSYTLHMIVNSIEPNFASAIQSGAIGACQKHGYNLVVMLMSHAILNDSAALQKWCADFIATKKPVGVILVPPYSDSLEINAIFNKANIAISRIGPNDIEDHNNTTVMINDRTAAKEATEYLISLGHKRIAFIRGKESQGATHKRFNGYSEALENAGITLEKSLVKPGDFGFESGMKAGQEFLTSPHPPTAIFAANDDMAAGVVVSAYMNNVKIPEELSVVGFDDSELAQRIWPSLSTIKQPIISYGERAVKMLIAQSANRDIVDETTVSKTELLEHKLIIRASTAPAPQGK